MSWHINQAESIPNILKQNRKTIVYKFLVLLLYKTNKLMKVRDLFVFFIEYNITTKQIVS